MWIRVDDDVIEHPKTYRLARILNTDRATAFGLLVAIWGYASRHHHDGDVTDMELAAIHKRVGWTSGGLAGGVLVPVQEDVRSALLAAGWADQLEDGRILLHDWDEHQGPMIDRRENDKKRKQLARNKRPQEKVRTPKPLSAGIPVLRNDTTRHDTSQQQQIERDSLRVETTGVPSPANPAPSGSVPPAVPTVSYLVRCVQALNRGIRANVRIGNPREVVASTQAGTVEWEQLGIPIALAERIIEDRAIGYIPAGSNYQPRSLKYFDALVREGFERVQQAQPLTGRSGAKDEWDLVIAKAEQEDRGRAPR